MTGQLLSTMPLPVISRVASSEVGPTGADVGQDPMVGGGAAAPRRWLLAPYVWWAGLAAAYSVLSLTRFASLSTPSWDNAIFQQAIAGYAHLRAPIVDIKGPGYNILGDHFSPVLAVLAPVYRLFPAAQTLLVAQAVLVAGSVVPITRIAVERLGSAGGWAVGVAYGLSFGLQSAVYTDFHEMAFAAPLMALAGTAYLRRRWWAVAGWTALLLLVKEDLGITVAAVGVLLMIAGARRLGAALAGIGMAGCAVLLFVVIPAVNRSGRFDYWSAVSFGRGGPSAWHTFVSGWDVKLPTLLLTFGITGFLALRSPWVLVAGPTLAWRWIGTNREYWDTNWHYSLILMPIVFIAMLDGIERARRSRPAWLRRYTEHLPTVVAAVSLVLVLQFPLHNLLRAATYQPNPTDVAAARAAIGTIPHGASVETNMGLITHLVSDHHVYWFGSIGAAVAPDYVLIDTHTDHDRAAIADYADRQHPGHHYEQIYDSDGYQVAERTL